MNKGKPHMDYLFAGEVAQGVHSGDLSPVAYVEHLLGRIGRADRHLKAFTKVLPDEAMYAARAAEAAVRRGGPLGPLHGVPVAVKDNIDVAGLPTTCQSQALADAPPASEDAEIVIRLRRAGAIIVGKLALEEFAIGDQDGGQQTRNPWNLERTAGGSSTGAGVAVAAGLVPVAIGTDTGGSVRNPAALCGVVGMKPTFGRLPVGGIFPLAPSLDHVGIITRTVADNALVFSSLTGQAPAVGSPNIAGLRVGIVRHFYLRDLPSMPEMVAAIEAAAETFQRLGAHVREVEIDPLDLYRACGGTVLAKESYEVHAALLKERGHNYSPLTRRLLFSGSSIDPAAYVVAQHRRAKARADLAVAMRDLDVLITGVAPSPACRLDDPVALEVSGNGAMRLPFNVTGSPALALPIGFSSDGLPLSLQVVGKPDAEDALFRASLAYEQAAGWPSYRPNLSLMDGAPPQRALDDG